MFKSLPRKKRGPQEKNFPSWSLEMKLNDKLCRTSSVSSGCKKIFFMEVLFILFLISIQETTKKSTFSLVFNEKRIF